MDYFLFYVESYLARGKSEEDKTAAVTIHLRGRECRWLYEKFSERGTLTEESRTFTVAKEAMPRELEAPEDSSNHMDEALSTNPRSRENERVYVTSR